MTPTSLATPTSLESLSVTELKGVGASVAATLTKLGIHTVIDLLFHLPIRYLDRTRITPLRQLRTNTSVLIQGRVVQAQVLLGRRRSLAVTIEDETGSTCLRFYHFNAAQKNSFEAGRPLRCYGDPRLGSSGIEFYHPEYEFLDVKNKQLEESLTPIYGLTEGLSQQRLRKLVEQAVAHLETIQPQELLDTHTNTRFGVDSLGNALKFLHFPPPQVAIDQILAGNHPYQQRLAFEELLAHFLARREIRASAQQFPGPCICANSLAIQPLLEALPFQLTGAQRRVIGEVERDLLTGLPMLRMVQGDVGCGKTLVAAITAIQTAKAGYQVAIVAPTEILAEQHFKNFHAWLSTVDLEVSLLVGKQGVKERANVLQRISDGRVDVVVGTHALFQETVQFHKLGLSIIDEQHRFGVDQRLRLRKLNSLGETPHQLVMTATPIPRTLAMTAYSDLDYSVIDELPPGRIPIDTVLISQNRRNQLIERVRLACQHGAQVYWVCPLIEDSETLSAANAEQTLEQLRENLPELAIGLVHGRLKPAEKEQVMMDFKLAQLHILVATTVIEVGVDVPNASLMIIENPERLGLAQLHQLRGRVGRGSRESHCVLLYGDKLSQQARERLQVLRESNDGFVIAEKDLQLRGPGELLGTRQTGDLQYRIADAQRDSHLIPLVHQTGKQMLREQPENCSLLIRRWIGDKTSYAQA